MQHYGYQSYTNYERCKFKVLWYDTDYLYKKSALMPSTSTFFKKGIVCKYE